VLRLTELYVPSQLSGQRPWIVQLSVCGAPDGEREVSHCVHLASSQRNVRRTGPVAGSVSQNCVLHARAESPARLAMFQPLRHRPESAAWSCPERAERAAALARGRPRKLRGATRSSARDNGQDLLEEVPARRGGAAPVDLPASERAY